MAEVLRGHHRCHFAKLAQRRQSSLHRRPRSEADQNQQQWQGEQRRTQIGAEQCLVVGVVHREQYGDAGAVLQTDQPGSGEEFSTLSVGAAGIAQLFGSRSHSFQSKARIGHAGAGFQQWRAQVAAVINRQREVVMAHDLIEQNVRFRADLARVDIQRQAVFDLFHLAGQAVSGQRIQFVGQGNVRQHREEHHQQGAEHTDGQPQPQRQACRLHSRASST
ncbi:hypothetical protein D3C84_831360 [compost metagenome]